MKSKYCIIALAIVLLAGCGKSYRTVKFYEGLRMYDDANAIDAPQVINVRQRGAKGDGATDDATAVQAAINTLSSGGGILFFPTGTYVIGSTITIPGSNIVIEGQNATINGGARAFSITGKKNITIRSLTLKNETLLYATNTTGIEIEDITASTPQVHLFMGFDNSHGIKIDRCEIYNSYYGAYFGYGTTDLCDNITVTNCKFYQGFGRPTGNYPVGLYFRYASNAFVENCTFKNILPSDLSGSHEGYGIYAGDGQCDGQLIVIKNKFILTEDAGSYWTGILDAQFPHCHIAENNFLSDYATMGCSLGANNASYPTKSIKVENNSFKKSSISLYHLYAEDVQIIGNSLTDAFSDAISLTPGESEYYIRNAFVSKNVIDGSTRGGIVVYGVDRATINDNIILNCNSSNSWDSNHPWYSAGIGFVNTRFQQALNNYIANTKNDGHIKIGIYSNAEHFLIADGNRFQGIE